MHQPSSKLCKASSNKQIPLNTFIVPGGWLGSLLVTHLWCIPGGFGFFFILIFSPILIFVVVLLRLYIPPLQPASLSGIHRCLLIEETWNKMPYECSAQQEVFDYFNDLTLLCWVHLFERRELFSLRVFITKPFIQKASFPNSAHEKYIHL